jgi:6-phosphogluconate dehydrogenase
MELFKSRTKDSDIYRAITLTRHGFGGHPFGKDDYIAKERKTSYFTGVFNVTIYLIDVLLLS